ncbi:MAG: Smr/MutS family protein, partial [Erysipelotrichaceae bacterium]|nr:Smr/MutS family protein [Erysipelotrichaceae bacterium]
KCIDPSGEVKDDATDNLKQINTNMARVEKDLYNRAYQFIDKHGDVLQEKTIILRNDRFVFLIKGNEKNRFQGYTYGTSSSGLAFYVEPKSFIDLNNQKIQLMHDREDEIDKILMDLTYLVSTVSDKYILNFESLVKLCVIFAKASYGYPRNGILPDLVEDRYFSFKDLCHPLIDPEKVVSNSYRIYEPYRGIVISGSNTGGKTVSLKSIGLSIIMSYLGMPVFAEEARIPFYRNIYIDIDDNQSIENSLSTFSAHITNINDILNKADDRSLILIDELISGTDPSEAQAISLAILDRIKEIGSIFIITTHFDEIKNYSYNDQNILLSSVGFNMETLSPTYRYYEDSIGSSNALEIASRYFDDPKIIDDAREYLKKNRSRQDEMLESLARQIDEVNLEKDKVQKLEQDLRDQNDQLKQKIDAFDAEKASMKARYQEELNESLKEIRNKAIEKLESIKEKDNKTVEEIESLITEEKETPVEFNVGDNVRVGDNEQVGTIIELNNDTASVDIRGLKVKVKTSQLTLMPKVLKQKTKVSSPRYSRVPAEFNVIGHRVEDALVEVEEYLDKANAAHMSNVKIIHGIGTGALRASIRDRLKKLSYVKSFTDGDFYDGGSAVTMVEFKK